MEVISSYLPDLIQIFYIYLKKFSFIHFTTLKNINSQLCRQMQPLQHLVQWTRVKGGMMSDNIRHATTVRALQKLKCKQKVVFNFSTLKMFY